MFPSINQINNLVLLSLLGSESLLLLKPVLLNDGTRLGNSTLSLTLNLNLGGLVSSKVLGQVGDIWDDSWLWGNPGLDDTLGIGSAEWRWLEGLELPDVEVLDEISYRAVLVILMD